MPRQLPPQRLSPARFGPFAQPLDDADHSGLANGGVDYFPSNRFRIVSISELLTLYGSPQLHMFRSKSYIIMPQSINSTVQTARPLICHQV